MASRQMEIFVQKKNTSGYSPRVLQRPGDFTKLRKRKTIAKIITAFGNGAGHI